MTRNTIKRQTNGEKITEALVGALFTVAVATLGWNYGASELVQALGGPDGNINFIQSGLILCLIVALKGVGSK